VNKIAENLVSLPVFFGQRFDMKREPNSAKWVNRKVKYILGSIFIWMNIVLFSMLDVTNAVHFIPK
jgi:polyferredoxin